jgi:hypothetical protein
MISGTFRTRSPSNILTDPWTKLPLATVARVSTQDAHSFEATSTQDPVSLPYDMGRVSNRGRAEPVHPEEGYDALS